MNRRSFLTGAASCATITATGGIGAVAGGVPASVVVPKKVVVLAVSEVMHEVWMSFPGQPMRLVGVGPEGIANEMVKRVQAGITKEMLMGMETMDMRPSAFPMPARVGSTTLEEANSGRFDLVADGQREIWVEGPIYTNMPRLDGKHARGITLVSVDDEDMQPEEKPDTTDAAGHDGDA